MSILLVTNLFINIFISYYLFVVSPFSHLFTKFLFRTY